MATVYKREDETLESMLKRFKKRVEGDEIMETYRRYEFYRSPSQKRRDKRKAAEIRRLRNQK